MEARTPTEAGHTSLSNEETVKHGERGSAINKTLKKKHGKERLGTPQQEENLVTR